MWHVVALSQEERSLKFGGVDYAWQLRKEELSKREARKVTSELAVFMKESYLELASEKQQEHLKQFSIVADVGGNGMIDGITNGYLRERLSITDRQANEMRKLLPDIRKELDAEVSMPSAGTR